MAEVILTADRLTHAEAKRVSKDLIGEIAPDFSLIDDAGDVFDSKTLDGSWRILFSMRRTDPRLAIVAV